ncbi:hypothetical protein [Streptomyces sp. NPDC059757]|uniref:hypothetical protein n=1 Tax=Streptomyces sp. NPDC059757 TaxID=3346935 RepID=UPI003668C37C
MQTHPYSTAHWPSPAETADGHQRRTRAFTRPANALLDLVLDARGCLRQWQAARTIHAAGSIGGLLWSLRGQEEIFAEADITADVQQQRLVLEGFTAGLRGVFTPDRAAFEQKDCEVLADRNTPRDAFASHRAALPVTLSTRCTSRATRLEQVFYYDTAGLLRRHDYVPDVLGGTPAAHFSEHLVSAPGLVFPTHRFVVPVQDNGRAASEPVLITIDLADTSVT